MKKPQIDDYATSPASLEKYQLDDMPTLEPRATREVSSGKTLSERANARTPKVSSSEDRRVIQRASFEVYQDQMKTLRRIAAEAMLNGEKGSMSEMVRSAIDEYVAKRKGK